MARGTTTQRDFSVILSNTTVHIAYKPVKTLRLRVVGQRVLCSAPLRLPHTQVIEFVQQQRQWIQQALAKTATATTRPNALATPVDAAAFLTHCQTLVAHWSVVMELPLPTVQVKPMLSKWGSCCPLKKCVQFNTALANVPPACLEYVVVHELAHFYEANHSARFKAVVTRYLPHWREQVRALGGFCLRR